MTDFSQPDSLLAALVDAVAEGIEEKLAENGFSGMKMLIVLTCDEAPAGERDSTIAGFGFEDSRELTAHLGAHFTAAMDAHGLGVQIHPLRGGPSS